VLMFALRTPEEYGKPADEGQEYKVLGKEL
jgi:hypothetical protein